MVPAYLYKVMSEEHWQASQEQKKLVPSAIDTEFFHLATEEQLAHVVQKFWANMDHIILKLDTKKIVGRLVYEANPGGTTKYYHLYNGTIPLDAVLEVKKVSAQK